MGEAYKCDKCVVLGNTSGIFRAPPTLAQNCGTCGPHDHTARQFRTATPTRMLAKIVVASPHGLPLPQEHSSGVSPPVAWRQPQGGFVMQGGAQQWDGAVWA